MGDGMDESGMDVMGCDGAGGTWSEDGVLRVLGTNQRGVVSGTAPCDAPPTEAGCVFRPAHHHAQNISLTFESRTSKTTKSQQL